MKLSNKMISICAAAIVSMVLLFAVNYYAANLVENATSLSSLRSSQLSMTNKMQLAQSTLLLAAMDAIIDKGDGEISAERMSIIVDSEKILRNGLIKAKEAADTDQEKKIAQDMVSNVDNLVAAIKIDLVELIVKSGSASVAIEKEFSKMDDTLDLYGDSLAEQLTEYGASIKEEVLEADETLLQQLKSSNIISTIVFVVALAVFIILVTMITLSIIKPINLIVTNMTSGAEQVSDPQARYLHPASP